jgi:hypothetical protein
MIEVTLIEMVLFAWAVLATAAAIKYKDEARASKRMLVIFVENKEAREQLLKAHAKFMEEQS